jgi:hypothetical protein
MAEITVRQNELVVTMESRERGSLTWFGLRKSRSKLLDGLELRVPLTKVTGVHVSDAYWELRDQMDGRNARRETQTRGSYAPPRSPVSGRAIRSQLASGRLLGWPS